MRADILIECVNVLNNADIDNPADQKAISVCENYIMHSYDLYLENCVEMGYPALSQQDYMLEILSLDEGFFKKLVKGAAITAAAGAAAYGGAKVVRANQAFRSANGISTPAGSSFKDRVSSQLKSTGQMFKQAAGTGTTVGEKIRGVAGTVGKTKVFGKDAAKTNAARLAGGTVTHTTDASTGKQKVQFQAGDGSSSTGTVVNRTVDGQGQETSSTSTASSGSATQDMQAAQQKAADANEKLRKAQEEAKEAEEEAKEAANKKPENGQNPPSTGSGQSTQQPTNESYSPFIASELKQPLTPAIRIHKSIM